MCGTTANGQVWRIGFLAMHDILLFYTKRKSDYVFNHLYTKYTENSLKRKQNYHAYKRNGKVYETTIDKRGVRENDVWNIGIIAPSANERTGYPTQKAGGVVRAHHQSVVESG